MTIPFMPFFTKESLELVKSKADLIEILSMHIDLKRAGTSFKALCPFHEEKTPSFQVQRGQNHYHCFGCGAHGDVIHFLMEYLKMSFVEAVQYLAERVQVPLQQEEQEQKGPNKQAIKDALDAATKFYHFMLLHTQEGHEALHYLYARGIDLDFIRTFQVGLAPKAGGIKKALNVQEEVLLHAGLFTENGREFFLDRITFPICNATGSVIGFSARKYKEETFGGKYINTGETLLFKKSQVLFGIYQSRKRIAKERQVIIVEGQIDCLRLIQEGFHYTVAGQGTAFGEGHVQQLLNLGVNKVYLALDPDQAGREASVKVGHLFQKEGVDVHIVPLPEGKDPDAFLREEGPIAFEDLLKQSSNYLSFLVQHLSQTLNPESPAHKTELVENLAKRIREWKSPLMVYESLRLLAKLCRVPEESLGIVVEEVPVLYVKKGGRAGAQEIDPARILEMDLLRLLLLFGKEKQNVVQLAQRNIQVHHFKIPLFAKLFRQYMEAYERGEELDLLSITIRAGEEEVGLAISEILQKKVKQERALMHMQEAIQKILERSWMEEREAIRARIQGTQLTDDEALQLARQFDMLKKNPPKVLL